MHRTFFSSLSGVGVVVPFPPYSPRHPNPAMPRHSWEREWDDARPSSHHAQLLVTCFARHSGAAMLPPLS